MKNKIGWCDQTWNPIIGCDKISEGCKECYAEKIAYRLAHMRMNQGESLPEYENVIDWKSKRWNGKTYFIESILQKPLKRKKPTKYFVCSMGDLFHESVHFEWIDTLFTVMSDCDHHTYQILTKRPERMKEFFDWKNEQTKELFNAPWVPKDNIWLGVTAENQERANERIPILLQIPAKVHFVSVEPMLGEISLSILKDTQDGVTGFYNALRGYSCHKSYHVSRKDDIYKKIPKLDWVICGGETGQNERPMKREWVENLLNQCKEANVPFFFKGWGTCQEFKGLKKLNTSHLIDGKECKEFPIIK